MKKTICALLVTLTLSSGVIAQENQQELLLGYFITDTNVNYKDIKNGFIAKQSAPNQETKYFLGIMVNHHIAIKNPTDTATKNITMFKGHPTRTKLEVGDWMDNKMLFMGYANSQATKIYPTTYKARHYHLPAMVTADNYPLKQDVRGLEYEGEIFIYADEPKEGKTYIYKMIEPDGVETREWVQKSYRNYGWKTTYSDFSQYGLGIMKDGLFCTTDEFARGVVAFYNGRTERKISMTCFEFEKSFLQQAKDKYAVAKDLVKREISMFKEKYL